MKSEVYNVLTQLLDGDLQHYQHRHLFRLADNEVVHITHRVSITFEEKHTVTEYGDDDQEYSYETNKEREFYWHVWFDKNGRIWFLADASAFPRVDGEFPFQIEKDYDRRTGVRYYFFGDIINREIMDQFRKMDEESAIERVYTWGGFDLAVEKLSDQDQLKLYPRSIFSLTM